MHGCSLLLSVWLSVFVSHFDNGVGLLNQVICVFLSSVLSMYSQPLCVQIVLRCSVIHNFLTCIVRTGQAGNMFTWFLRELLPLFIDGHYWFLAYIYEPSWIGASLTCVSVNSDKAAFLIAPFSMWPARISMTFMTEKPDLYNPHCPRSVMMFYGFWMARQFLHSNCNSFATFQHKVSKALFKFARISFVEKNFNSLNR